VSAVGEGAVVGDGGRTTIPDDDSHDEDRHHVLLAPHRGELMDQVYQYIYYVNGQE